MKMKSDIILATLVYGIWISLGVLALYFATGPDWLAEETYADRRQEMYGEVNRGILLSSQGKDHEAIEKYEYVLKIIPEFTEAYINLGVSLMAIGKKEEALKVYKKGLETARYTSDSANLYMNMHDYYNGVGDSLQAIRFFDLGIERIPFIFESLMKRARHTFYTGDYDEGFEKLALAIGFRPNMKAYYIDMLYRESENPNYSAEERELIRKQAQNPMLIQTLAVSRFDSLAFIRNLNKDRGFAKNYNMAGYILALQEKYGESLPWFGKALKIWPDYKDALENIQFVQNKLSALNKKN